MSRIAKMFVPLWAVAMMLALPAAAKSPILKELEDAFVQLHDGVRPVVVNIETKGKAPEGGEMEEFFHMFGLPTPDSGPRTPRRRPVSTGSGFIYSKDGYIITNNHVVEDASEVTVRLWNGDEYEADVVGADPDTDLAVIQIEADDDLPVATLGDSDKLKVGQYAVAVGSARGFEGSMSYGHISALGREDLAGLRAQGLRFQNLIQTDAAINLGNSGGPLTNIDGEVVGINVAIVWGANSIGFAIPINTAKEIVPQLISQGKVVRGYLGVGIREASQYASALNLPDSNGAFVTQVQPGTPAAEAGIQTYDVIRKVEGKVIEDDTDLVGTISSYQPGKEVSLEVWRDGEPLKLTAELAEWQPQEGGRTLTPGNKILGMTYRGLSPEIAERLGLEPDTQGVLITSVEPGSPAEDAGLIQGDIILEVGQKDVTSPSEFRELVKEYAVPGESFLVRYIRGSSPPDITVIEVPK